MYGEVFVARLFSGIQPSGKLTIGHYVGTINNWLELQKCHESLFCVVDLHAITVAQDPKIFQQNIREAMALFVACGLDYKKNILFLQSHVSAHSQLAWILQCFAPLGYLNRMTQFKDKSQQHANSINAGLLTYPALMAADILLYDAEIVPVGEDQKQHLEFTRDLAEKFNYAYGDIFKLPNPSIVSQGARVMSLQDPTKKMSKSDPNNNAWIALLDSPELINKKIKKAVTDSVGLVAFDESRPGICNLMNLYSCFSGKTLDDIELEYQGQGYGSFKADLADLVISKFSGIQSKYQEVVSEPDFIEGLIQEGASRAGTIAANTLNRVSSVMGFI